MRFARTAVAALVASTSLIAVAPALPAAAVTADLIISEYIEGSSFNKAIEIYNGTGASVDLAGYQIGQYSNGSTSTSVTLNPTGTLAAGDVYVIAHSSANAAILAAADLTSGAGLFNGDDALVLSNGGAVVDSIGQVGFDPGSEWGTGLVSTADNTLRRAGSVCAGDTDPSDAFDPSAEWVGFATDTFDGLGTHTADCGGGTVAPVINEFSASTAGTDVEYVEIHAAPDTDLSAYSVIEIEGDAGGTGTVDEVISLGTTDANGLYLASLPANALENGTITLLLVEGFTGALGADLDTNDDGVLDVTPWSAIVDDIAVNDGGGGDLAYAVALGVGYDGAPFAPGGASRIPDGADTDTTADWVRNDFDLAGIPNFTGTPVVGEAYNTPGAPNEVVVPPPAACGDPITAIAEIQGSGAESPLEGSEVAIAGVVVGDFQTDPDGNNPLRGFNVQDAGDSDPATSDGIFVFNDAVPVSVGDVVHVVGTVVEFNGLTEISAGTVLVCDTGAALPAPVALSLPVASLAEFEAVEGMRVTFPQDLVISEYFNYDRFGEIVLTDVRQPQPTAVVEPGPDAVELAALQTLGRITLDDARTNQNPDPAIHPDGTEFTLDNLFRGGDTVADVTGVMDYSFGLYRIQPTQGADHTSANPRGPVPDVGGNLQVASFNVLNYFHTIDDGTNDICGANARQECRGADDEEERTRQLAKIVAALDAIDADVVGIIEVENTPGVEAMADIVNDLNAAAGFAKYAYVDTGVIGTDAIKVGLIYQPAIVTPVGDYAILDSSVDPRFVDTANRPALAQTFMNVETGGLVTVVVNHLKSKGSDCNDLGDPDLGDGAGNCNITRTLAAEALVDWTAGDPTGVDAPTLIIGDLNSYDKEEPIDVLVAGGYTDLVARYEGELAYSYVFDGKIGYLDHALADADLLPDVTGTAIWHINADEPDLIDYDTSFKADAQDDLYAPDPYRSSDHDPVIVGLDVCDAVAPELDVTLDRTVLWPPNHQLVPVTATVVASDNFDDESDLTVELVSVTSNEPDDGEDDGNTTGDIVIHDDTTFELRAERSGVGTGRVYTVTYSVTDSCGNTTTASATVSVPLRFVPGVS